MVATFPIPPYSRSPEITNAPTLNPLLRPSVRTLLAIVFLMFLRSQTKKGGHSWAAACLIHAAFVAFCAARRSAPVTQ